MIENPKHCQVCGEQLESNAETCNRCMSYLVKRAPTIPSAPPPPPPGRTTKPGPPPLRHLGVDSANIKTGKTTEEPFTKPEKGFGGKYNLLILLILIASAGAVIASNLLSKPERSPAASNGSTTNQQESRQTEQPVQDLTFSRSFAVPDGIYKGSAEGMSGLITVEVQLSGGQITAINVLEHSETITYFMESYPLIADRIIAEQKLSVDTQTGATASATGIIAAVKNALSSAE